MREINPNETDKLYECLEALAEHHNKVSVYFKGCYPQTPSEQKIRQFKSELEEGRARIAVAENADKVIGFCKINTDARPGVLEYLVVLDRENKHTVRAVGEHVLWVFMVVAQAHKS